MSRLPSLALLALLPATLAPAAPPAEPTPAAPPPAAAAAPIPAAQIGERAAETTARLRAMRARETAAVPDLADLAAQVDRLAREAALLDTTEPTTQALDDLAQRLATLRDALASHAQPLMARTDAIEHDFARLHDEDTLWTATETAARESNLPAAVRDTVRRVRVDIRDTRTHLRTERDAALDALARLASLQARVNDALDDVAVARKRFRGDLLSRDSPPLWTAARDPAALAADLGRLGAGIARSQRAATTFVAAQAGRLAAQALLFVAIVAGTLALAQRRRRDAAALCRRRRARRPPGHRRARRPAAGRRAAPAPAAACADGPAAAPRG